MPIAFRMLLIYVLNYTFFSYALDESKKASIIKNSHQVLLSAYRQALETGNQKIFFDAFELTDATSKNQFYTQFLRLCFMETPLYKITHGDDTLIAREFCYFTPAILVQVRKYLAENFNNNYASIMVKRIELSQKRYHLNFNLAAYPQKNIKKLIEELLALDGQIEQLQQQCISTERSLVVRI